MTCPQVLMRYLQAPRICNPRYSGFGVSVSYRLQAVSSFPRSDYARGASGDRSDRLLSPRTVRNCGIVRAAILSYPR
ncbi:hypothetical protein CLF_102830, partial [Clonorchis sinensis]